MTERRVVIVEDEILIAEYLRDLCTNYGVEVVGMEHDPDGAESSILRERPDFVLMDVRLGAQRDGIDVAECLNTHLPGLKIVFVTGSTERATLDRIDRTNPHQVLIKPIVPGALQRALA